MIERATNVLQRRLTLCACMIGLRSNCPSAGFHIGECGAHHPVARIAASNQCYC